MSTVGRPAESVVRTLTSREQTISTAESLTGGLVVAELTSVSGSSAVVNGGVCAYHPDVKHRVVGVSRKALATGAVNEAVARQLAEGAARVFGTHWGIGTTGVAGPEAAPDAPVGTVHIAVTGPEVGTHHRELSLAGDRDTIRRDTVASALDLLLELLTPERA